MEYLTKEEILFKLSQNRNPFKNAFIKKRTFKTYLTSEIILRDSCQYRQLNLKIKNNQQTHFKHYKILSIFGVSQNTLQDNYYF